MKLAVNAPDNVILLSLSAAGSVTEGQQLARLRCPRLERLASSLTAMETHIEIIERPFHDGRLDEEIDGMNDKIALLVDVVEKYESQLSMVEAEYEAGAKTLEDLNTANIMLFQAKAAAIDGRLSASQATRKKDDLFDKINTAKLNLRRERAFLETMVANLTITSPVSGSFEPNVATGHFVKLGDPIGEIEV